MLNVFVKKSAEELHVQLSNGRMMPLKDLVRDYERLLNEESFVSKLKVGEWFRIDRAVINKNKEEIKLKCNEAGRKGKELWKRFEESNKIADENPNEYPRIIETYIFMHDWDDKSERKMRYMCELVGNGMCDEVICDLELQMRICNGETVNNLVQKADKLPYVRVIKLRNGGTGYFGGGVALNYNDPPANLIKSGFTPDNLNCIFTPYAFRKGFRRH